MPLFRNFWKCDYAAVNAHFDTLNLDAILEHSEVDPCVSKFFEVVSSAIVSHISLSGQNLDNFPKWYTPELKSLIIDKKSADADFKRSLVRLTPLNLSYSVLSVCIYQDRFTSSVSNLRSIRYSAISNTFGVL